MFLFWLRASRSQIKFPNNCFHETIKHTPFLTTESYVETNEKYQEKYYFHLSTWGLFSEINNMINAMILCLIEQKQFVLVDANWNYGKWDDYFDSVFYVEHTHPVSKSHSFDRSDLNHPTRLWNMSRDTNILSRPCDIFQTCDLYTRRKILAHIIFRPKIGYCVSNIQDQTCDYIGVHIRAGDKIDAHEMKKIEINKYAQKIQQIAANYNIYNVFYASDDSRLIKNISEQLGSDFSTMYADTNNNNSGYSQHTFNYYMSNAEKRTQFSNLINEVMSLIKSKYLVCTFSSNVSRFVALFIPLSNCYSLDDVWYPL